MTKLTKYLLIVLGICIIAIIIYIFELQSTNITNPTLTTSTTPQKQKNDTEMTFMFAGDAMFGRAIYAQFHDDLTEAFQNLGKNFFQGDITMLNLEGPMVQKEFTPDTNPNNLIMKFPPQTKDALSWLGVNTVGLANNHTLNQDVVNLEYTRQTLTNAQIMTVGDPQNSTDLVKTFQKENLKIAILAVNILANTPDLKDEIKKQKNDDAFVIIFPHWGNEYQSVHSTQQEKLAHIWIDEGADMIVGSHPHVIQDAEIYQEKPIFYSLGNFLFDQTFSQETQKGLIVKGKISQTKLTLELIPIGSLHLRPYALEEDERKQVFKTIKKSLGDKFDDVTGVLKLDIKL